MSAGQRPWTECRLRRISEGGTREESVGTVGGRMRGVSGISGSARFFKGQNEGFSIGARQFLRPAKLPSRAAKRSSGAAKFPSRAAKLPSRAAKLPSRTAKLPSRTAKLPSRAAKLPSGAGELFGMGTGSTSGNGISIGGTAEFLGAKPGKRRGK